MARHFTDLIDLAVIRPLMQSFSRTSGLPMSIIDLEGRALITSDWQKVCTLFHRRFPISLQRCIESDTDFSRFREGEPPAPGDAFESRCRNGLVHIGLPIVIEGEHLATLFLSQFFYDPPDLEFFRRQARELAIDEDPYLEAVRQVPVLNRSRVQEVLGFYAGFVRLLAEQGTQRLRQLEARRELEASEEKFRSIFEGALDSIVLVSPEGRLLEANSQTSTNLGYSRDELLRLNKMDIHAPSDHQRIKNYIGQVLREGSARMETVQLRSDGSFLPVEISGRRIDYLGEPAVLCLTRDISERKSSERILRHRLDMERLLFRTSSRFAQLPPAELNGGILRVLEDLGIFAGADRCYIFLFRDLDRQTMDNTHEWCAPGVTPERERLQGVPVRDLPWAMDRICSGEVLHVPRVKELGPEAMAEKKHFSRQSISSLLAVPVCSAGEVAGLLGLDAVKKEKIWSEEDIHLLQMMGDLIGNALERQKAQRQLLFRMALEEHIAAISTRFVNLMPAEVDGAIFQALEEIGRFVDVDRSYVFEFSEDGRTMSNTHEWCAEGIEPQRQRIQDLPLEALPRFIDRIRNNEAFYCPRVADLRPEAAAEKAEWQAQEIQSLICVPMTFSAKVLGFIGFDSVRRPKEWPEDIILLLRIVGECFAGALARRRVDETLRESEERFRSIFMAAAVGMITVGPGGRFTQVNPAFCRFLGYPAAELLAMTVYEVTHPQDREKSRMAIRKAAEESSTFELEKRYIRSDGSIRWGHVTGVWIRDSRGRPVNCVVQIQDVSRRREAEEGLKRALREAEEAREKIDAILGSVGEGLIVTDLFDRVVLMNGTAENLLGIFLADSPLRHIDSLLPEEGIRRQIVTTRKEGRGREPFEWEVKKGEREPHLVLQARSTPVRSPEGRMTGIITLLRDITREREMDRMKDEFISTAAHELRTPLATIMGFVELLIRQEEYAFSLEEQREFLQLIYRKSEVLAQIIEDLLDLSRVRSGHLITLNKSRADVVALITQAVDAYRGVSRKHVFSLQLPRTPVFLPVDPGKIGQILENLLSNAVKFSPSGGIISVLGRRTDGEFQVTVIDEGIGMRPDQMERMFDKFYRADASNTAVSGLGLGMSIVKSIVEAHGGRIWVESEPGRGTLVHFTLSLKEDPPPA